MPRDAITILHLSDMQFGKNHCFGTYGPDKKPLADVSYDTLLARLKLDLDEVKRDLGVWPELVAVTGDLVEWGLQSEFEQAKAFLEGLAEHLGIKRDERYRIAIIPGNHDIDRLGAEQDFIAWKRRGKKGDPFGFTRWEYFAQMFEAFYAAIPKNSGLRPEYVNDRPYSVFKLPEHHLVFAGLNSTMAECHLETPDAVKEFGKGTIYGHHGYGGEDQWRFFEKELGRYETKKWLRVGLIHHNLNRAFEGDEECLRYDDSKALNRILGPHLNLLLHGHTHSADADSLKNGVPVLSTGTPSLGQAQKPPGEPNQYQIIQLRPDGITTTCRAWSMKDQRFVTDGGKGGNQTPGVVTRDVAWKNADAAFPAPLLFTSDDVDSGFKAPAKRDPAIWGGDFMEAVMRPQSGHSPMLEQLAAICRLRYEEPDISPRSDGPVPYLRIVTRTPFQRVFAVGALPEGLNVDGVNAFHKVHESFVQLDPFVENHLVYAGSLIPTNVMKSATSSGFKVWSYYDFQRICSLTEAVEAQTRRLEADTIYPPELYVDQEISIYSRNYHRSGDADIPETGLNRRKGALQAVSSMLEGTAAPSFVLVHGDFGAGKTFLLRQLALKFHEQGYPLIPIFIELRSLEKDFSLDQHLAAHFARQGVDMPVIPKAALRYMLEQGHLLLLFDGYDELARNVTFDTAAQYLKNLAEAAGGRAKVVLTVRTQHFLYDRQMVEHLAGLPGFQRLRLEPFTEEQILQFLVNKFRISRLGDEVAAKARLELLREVKDLLGLSQNPRMLSFIAELEEDRLREAQAREKDGRISAGSLYQIILDQWLANEIKRRPDNRQKDADRLSRLWLSVEKLALVAWPKQERVLDETECVEVAKQVISELLATQLHPREEAQAVASGSLLSREGEGRFAFAHQSILEWLVAREAAKSIKADQNPAVLCQQEMTHLMADFLIDLGTTQKTFDWVGRMMLQPDTETGIHGKPNALLVSERLSAMGLSVSIFTDNECVHVLVGQDMRGKNLDSQNFSGADFSHADLELASLRNCDLRKALFIHANLTSADLTGADLRGADLTGADFTRATLIGADLRGAVMTDSQWELARLAGAALDDPQLTELNCLGAGLPLVHRPPALLPGAARIHSFAWSPVRDHLVTGDDNGCITVWDALSSKPLQTFQGHQGSISCLAFSPDGSRLVSGSADNTLRLWDALSGKLLFALQGHSRSVNSIAFAPDSSRFASGSGDRTLRLWDAVSGMLLKTFLGHQGSVNCVTFSPNSTCLASASDDNTVHLWDALTGEQLYTLIGHKGPVFSVAFAPDGSRLVSGSDDKTLRLWNALSGKPIRTVSGHFGSVYSVSFAADGSRLASGSADKTLRIWDSNNGKPLHTLQGHQGFVYSVAFGPDGSRLASSSADKTLRIWDSNNGKSLHTLQGHQSFVYSVAFTPDGSRLAVGSADKNLSIWDTLSGKLLDAMQGHQGTINCVAFSPKGFHLASGSDDKTLCLWNAIPGKPPLLLQGHTDWVRSIAFAPDSSRLASGSDDKTIRLWDVRSGKHLLTLNGHQNYVNSVVFSPDGSRLASGSDDNTLRLWDTHGGKQLLTLKGHQDAVCSVAYGPDGSRLASGSSDKTLRLWDTSSGKRLHTLQGHTAYVWSVAFDPNGSLLASGSADKTLRLWDAHSGKHLLTLKGHQGSVWSVAFWQGRVGGPLLLVSASSDGTLRIWDAEQGTCLGILLAHGDSYAALRPDGRYRVVGNMRDYLWHVSGLVRYELGELDEVDPHLKLAEDEPLIPPHYFAKV